MKRFAVHKKAAELRTIFSGLFDDFERAPRREKVLIITAATEVTARMIEMINVRSDELAGGSRARSILRK